jgi:hypothetical protein
MQEVISIKEALVIAVPAFSAAVLLVILMAYRSTRLARRVQDYKMDSYRQSVELQIAKLQDQLMISLDRFENVNHLLIEGQKAVKNSNANKINSQNFFWSLGVDTSDPVDSSLIFVLMPFNNETTKTYHTIKKMTDDFGFRTTRGDDEYQSSSILSHIVRQIVRARLIIADISGRNPNVFYELGIAHALNKSVLMIARSAVDIPFDVGSTRVLVYNDDEELRIRLSGWIIQSLNLEKNRS